MTTRRGFLQAMLAMGAAPMIVRADSLMALVQVHSQSFRTAVLGFQRETVASVTDFKGLWTYSAYLKPDGQDLWQRKTLTVKAGVEVGVSPTGNLVAVNGLPIRETTSETLREFIPHQQNKYTIFGQRDGYIAPLEHGGIRVMGAGLEVSLQTPLLPASGPVMPLVEFTKGIA